MKNIILIIACLISIKTYSQDEDYDFVSKTTENINLYIKASTIKIESQYQKQYKVWVMGYIDKEDLLVAQSKLVAKYKDIKLKKTYTSKTLFYVDCNEDKISVCRVMYYDKDGNVLVDGKYCEYFVDYNDVVPETVGEYILNYVCKYANENFGE